MPTDARKFLETVAGERCPCGHLGTEHETVRLPGEKMGPCRYVGCECKGLIDFTDELDLTSLR